MFLILNSSRNIVYMFSLAIRFVKNFPNSFFFHCRQQSISFPLLPYPNKEMMFNLSLSIHPSQENYTKSPFGFIKNAFLPRRKKIESFTVCYLFYGPSKEPLPFVPRFRVHLWAKKKSKMKKLVSITRGHILRSFSLMNW